MRRCIGIILEFLLLIILCIFPFCISILIEYALYQSVEFTSKYLVVPLQLIGALIAFYYFMKRKCIYISFRCDKKFYLTFFLIGLSLKAIIIMLICIMTNNGIKRPDSIDIYSFFIAVFFTPISEEIIFRVILTEMFEFKIIKKSKEISVIISSLIWTILHFYGFSLGSVMLFIDGIILGIIYKKYNNLILCILYHIGVNLSVYIVSICFNVHKIGCITISVIIFLFSIILHRTVCKQ